MRACVRACVRAWVHGCVGVRAEREPDLAQELAFAGPRGGQGVRQRGGGTLSLHGVTDKSHTPVAQLGAVLGGGPHRHHARKQLVRLGKAPLRLVVAGAQLGVAAQRQLHIHSRASDERTNDKAQHAQ